MNQHSSTRKRSPLKALGWTLAFLLLLLGIMEGWRYHAKPAPGNQTSLVEQNMRDAAETFQQYQQRFLGQTKELSSTLQAQLSNNADQSALYQNIRSFPEFWGTKLLKNGELFIWDGFEVKTINDDSSLTTKQDTVFIKIAKQNNVIFWQFDVVFTIQRDTAPAIPFHLITTARLEQSNALPIGQSSEFNLVSNRRDKPSGGISFNFFNTMPQNTVNYQVLRSIDGDSVGVAYARMQDTGNPLQNWQENNWFWRSIFIAFFFICISFAVSRWAEQAPKWTGLLFELCLIAIAWLVFYYLNIPSRWIPELVDSQIEASMLPSYIMLGNYGKAGIFIFLISICLHNTLNQIIEQDQENRFLSTIFIGFLTGAGNLSAILGITYSTLKLAESTQLPLLDLNIIPTGGTILLFLAIGLAFFGMGLSLIAINHFVIHSRRSHSKLTSALIVIGFGVMLLAAQIFAPDAIRLNWSVILAIICFSIIYGINYIQLRYTGFINQLSTLRTLVLASALLAFVTSPIIYHAYLQQQDQNLKSISNSFAQTEDAFAQELTAEILSQLGNTFAGITTTDLENRVPFLQQEFTSTIERLIPANKQSYSLDLQLIKPRGELIADYSTDLNSPNWVNVFDLPRLSAVIEIEQISKRTLRPVVQHPELKNKGAYETFYRGWIPIFSDTSDEVIAWILCSVYKERPDFNKPIRAVLASLTYNDWNQSYLMADYQNKELYSYAQQGITGYYPTYNRLLEAEQEALSKDSLVYYTSQGTQNHYRNLLIQKTPERVIKTSTISPGFKKILFSFFKLNFLFLAAGSTGLLLLHFLGIKKFTFLKQHQYFQNRILDNFLLATLLFLIMLVLATHYIIKQQNKELVQQELFSKLESLTKATQENALFKESKSISSSFTLDSLTAPLNVDASFYADRNVTESTTPQIYQQHILSSSLPYPVFNQLYRIQKRDALENVTLASQNLLIGYRSVLSADNKPVAAIAIPTFAQSPTYNRQLLETISYLVVLYLVVFGIFIVGTAFIARQLTKPLKRIQRGLDKISKGNLDTTIPVTSNDEIGSLAEAYNTMVYQLKELQKELAVAEREAAWKEMAQQVAHEIKNPLTPMKLNIQHLERQLKSNEVSVEELKPKIVQITKNLIEQIQSLNNIASDFSKFSQPIDQDFSDVEINGILKSIKNLYINDEDITITLKLADDRLTISGIADELRRVFINLVKNAFEAMPEGGTITIKTYTKKNSVFVEVEDNGMGIDEEDKPKIFVPNFSTKSSGTGLGLAICKKVIEAHEGNISFASIKGKGTTFIIKIPLAV